MSVCICVTIVSFNLCACYRTVLQALETFVRFSAQILMVFLSGENFTPGSRTEEVSGYPISVCVDVSVYIWVYLMYWPWHWLTIGAHTVYHRIYESTIYRKAVITVIRGSVVWIPAPVVNVSMHLWPRYWTQKGLPGRYMLRLTAPVG